MQLVSHLLIFQTFLVIVLCDNSDVFTMNTIAKHGVNFMDIVNQSQLNLENISIPCSNQINYLATNNMDALIQMADSWSRFPYTGFLYASRMDYGNYDECVSVKVQDANEETILGKQCIAGLVIPDITAETTDEMINKAWKLAYCVPHLCTADDLNRITNLSLFNDYVCSTQENDSELDTGAIVTIIIFSVIGLCMVLSTIYDVWYYKPHEKGSHFIFTCFSVYSNGKRLLIFARHSKEQILCFHGIKFISMWWIIAGHNAVSWLSYTVMNDQWRTGWQNSAYSQYLLSAHLSVDSFFFISGFLLAYLYFKNALSRKPFVVQLKAIPSMILHRYLRLTPAVLMTFLFGVYVIKYTGNGPIFSYQWKALSQPCKDNWWAVFLYVQNYYIFNLGTELCFTSLWYVCADMQLFLVAPLIILPIAVLHKRSFKITMAALLVINILFIGLPIVTKMLWKDYDPDLSEYDFQSRLTDYFIGVMMGVFMRNRKVRDFKIRKMTNLLTWIIVLVGLFGVVIATHQVNIHCDYNGKAIWYSLSRPLWCIGLSWITFACFTGHGGFINWILSNRFMQLGGKLTYCIYLVHGPLIIHYTLFARERRYFDDYYLFFDWAGYFILAMVIATIWSLAFELPMITIEKLIFGRPVDKKLAKKEENKQEK